MILAGDIGGTKTSLALFEREGDRLKILSQHRFESRKYETLGDIIHDFRQMYVDILITSASFAIAGPIIEQRCRTTNLPWEISAHELKDLLNITQVFLLNDLEATAYGMLCLDKDEFINLNPNAVYAKGNCAVIAAGTGLGESMLYYDGTSYHPIASEGGHCDFAPLNEQQDALLLWLRQHYPKHVSLERILSGPGISALYDFLHESGFAPESDRMKNLSEKEDKNGHISKNALEFHDPLCIETLRLFCEIYGAETGNLALKTMSLGGVYIGGGIAPKILPFLQSDAFINAFVAKGRFEPMLRNISVKVSLNPETALLGAAHFAKRYN